MRGVGAQWKADAVMSRVEEAVSTIKNGGPRTRPHRSAASWKAGIVFPVEIVHRSLEDALAAHGVDADVEEEASVYVAAVLEYVTAEITELSGNETYAYVHRLPLNPADGLVLRNGTREITPGDIVRAVFDDPELRGMAHVLISGENLPVEDDGDSVEEQKCGDKRAQPPGGEERPAKRVRRQGGASGAARPQTLGDCARRGDTEGVARWLEYVRAHSGDFVEGALSYMPERGAGYVDLQEELSARTPLEAALEGGHAHAARLLLRAGAELDLSRADLRLQAAGELHALLAADALDAVLPRDVIGIVGEYTAVSADSADTVPREEASPQWLPRDMEVLCVCDVDVGDLPDEVLARVHAGPGTGHLPARLAERRAAVHASHLEEQLQTYAVAVLLASDPAHGPLRGGLLVSVACKRCLSSAEVHPDGLSAESRPYCVVMSALPPYTPVVGADGVFDARILRDCCGGAPMPPQVELRLSRSVWVSVAAAYEAAEYVPGGPWPDDHVDREAFNWGEGEVRIHSINAAPLADLGAFEDGLLRVTVPNGATVLVNVKDRHQWPIAVEKK